MTYEEAKRQAAKEFKHLIFGVDYVMKVSDRAAELYARSKWDEAINEYIKELENVYRDSNIKGFSLLSDTTFKAIKPEFKP